jgi:2-polyprenyl-3-methyl-5-hydroxy-6-metoxy-1,4-benzoquinol methylase
MKHEDICVTNVDYFSEKEEFMIPIITPPPPQGIIRYGKSMFDILNVKSPFFNENEKLLNTARKTWAIYKQQPKRTQCKLCGSTLPHEKIFTDLGVDFFLCENCGHLNGAHQDTVEYAEAVYSGEGLGEFYIEPSITQYIARLESIYIPKALFLSDCLRSLNVDTKNFLDVGCGCGYMVGAMQRLGYSVRGIDMSDQEVAYGNRMLGGNYLQTIQQNELADIVGNATEQVLSIINVLEHVSDLSTVLEAIQSNKNVQYMFFAVPFFSLSNIFGLVFPDVFNRQLATTHTHLFSFKSIEWMNKKYGFESVARWNFGADIMDLYRSIMVKLNPTDKKLSSLVSDFFKSEADSMQLLVDKSNFCSEAHMLVKINHI